MSVHWKTIRVSATSIISLVLLAACQGQDGFQAKVYTPTEAAKIEAEIARKKGVNPKDSSQQVDSNAPANPAAPAKPDASEKSATPLPPAGVSYRGPGAHGELIHAGETQGHLMARNFADLNEPNDDANKVFQTLDIYALPTSTALTYGITVDSQIELDGKIYTMSVAPYNVTFKVDMSNEVQYLPITLKDQNGTSVAVQQDSSHWRVIGSVSCNDLKNDQGCNKNLVVRFDVVTNGNDVATVFLVQINAPGDNQPSSIVGQNVRGDLPKSYLKAYQESLKPKKDDAPTGNETAKDLSDMSDRVPRASDIRMKPLPADAAPAKPAEAYDPLSSIQAPAQTAPPAQKEDLSDMSDRVPRASDIRMKPLPADASAQPDANSAASVSGGDYMTKLSNAPAQTAAPAQKDDMFDRARGSDIRMKPLADTTGTGSPKVTFVINKINPAH
jgi:hypothetical protein